jgi:hypothetical protein
VENLFLIALAESLRGDFLHYCEAQAVFGAANEYHVALVELASDALRQLPHGECRIPETL